MDDIEIYGYVLRNIEKLENMGFDKDTLESIIYEKGLKEKVDFQQTVEELLKEDKNELLIKLWDGYFEEYSEIFSSYSYFEAFYKYFCPYKPFNPEKSFLGMAQVIKKYPELDFDDMSIRRIKTNVDSFDIFTNSEGRMFIMFGCGDVREISEGDNLIPADTNLQDIEVNVACNNGKIKFYNNMDKSELASDCIFNMESNIDDLENELQTLERWNRKGLLSKAREQKKEQLEMEIRKTKERIAKRRENSKKTGNDRHVITTKEIGKGILPELNETEQMDNAKIRLAARTEQVQMKEEKINGSI